ncbi:DUF2977 domain-containing protein [Pediococcus acidilactici]|uniref:DUF2977 domain-containing protein n=1 Tax=Pediococcus acidilactici TaxID=1254 RepID=UPI00254B1C10|nr:DUF2977 domain-containing protein [Pediococcus acidilactici]WIL71474.1 DUF2977 domain-containing protein [Pediococcus acidilactici]
MQLIVNDNNEITAYATVGNIGGIECTGDIPNNFYSDFKPAFFLFKDGKIYENPNYIEPSNDIPDTPSKADTAIAALTLQVAKQSEKQDEFNAQLLLKLAQLGGGANV